VAKAGDKRAGSKTEKGSASAPESRSILIVDDHPIVRAGLVHLLRREEDLTVCGEASSAAEAISAASELKPDLALVDISLEGANGIELTKSMRQTCPDVPVLVLSMHDEHLYAERALRAGARGYVMKQEATGTLLQAIRRVLQGDLFVSDKVASRMVAEYVGEKPGEAHKSGVEILTDRELEIFELIGRGLSTRRIAQQLNVSIKTVEAHRTHIRQKLHLSDTAGLAQRAARWVAGGMEE